MGMDLGVVGYMFQRARFVIVTVTDLLDLLGLASCVKPFYYEVQVARSVLSHPDS